MTQNDKYLLLKDLCARLLYGVKLSYRCNHIDILKGIHKSSLIVITDVATNVSTTTDVENTKPYLFPLSSMTEEQKIEYKRTCTLASLDWLNNNHFDYRGLIEKGLAIDATGKNIY